MELQTVTGQNIEKCKKFATHLCSIRTEIIELLTVYQSHTTTEYEIDRSIECLNNTNEVHLTQRTQIVAIFFPLNMPIYSLVLYATIPSLLADQVFLRTPVIMESVLPNLADLLKLKDLFPNIGILKDTRENFVQKYAANADVTIFTGKETEARETLKKTKNDNMFLFIGCGCNPIVVARSAEPRYAANKIVKAKTFNSGQNCAGPDNILVHKDVKDKFLYHLELEIKGVKVGSYTDPEVTVGKIAVADGLRDFASLLPKDQDNIEKGGVIDCANTTVNPTIIEITEFLRRPDNGKELGRHTCKTIYKRVGSLMKNVFGLDLVLGFVSGSVAKATAKQKRDINTMVMLTSRRDETKIERYRRALGDLSQEMGMSFNEKRPAEIVTLDQIDHTFHNVDGFNYDVKGTYINQEAFNAGIWMNFLAEKKAGIQYSGFCDKQRLLKFKIDAGKIVKTWKTALVKEDIAQTIALVVKVVRALDRVDGAGASCCEAVAFLTRLRRTLEPLQTVSALQLLPNYVDNIRELVDEIQDPISHFLVLTAEFEQLGSHSKHHQYIMKKLQWRFKTSKKVDELRRGIESRLGILDSFLQRVTLETVVSMEAKLGEQLRRTFQEVVDPRLVSILQQQSQPVTERLVETQMLSQQPQEEILSKLDCHASTFSNRTMRNSAPPFHSASQSEYDAMLSNFERIDISQDVAVNTIKQHTNSAINDLKSDCNHEIGGKLLSRRNQIAMRRRGAELDQPPKALETSHHEIRTCGSLEDFMTLAQRLKPMPVFTPTLLAKYHISFYNALGSPPRILDINCFARYKVGHARHNINTKFF
ncbi:hypothetical protein HYALB_00005053 [Hymenoscyphus albidus]|uniref:Aldehyde dehydrogenase domain-containing protein n=1 Tax=Hymenoscyphus albidus TaxID=595503 RepID=A0A9N9Q7Y6_9HELO|nr:hypothetical protein HYALB_00005053 [Hymenoscyphus albidus]